MIVYSIVSGGFSHKEEPLLENVTFQLQSSSRVVLSGPSGIGKSTLLQLIFGSKTWNVGDETRDCPVHFQPQNDLLFPWKTVRENLVFTTPPQTEIDHYLDQVGLAHAVNLCPGELSQGMKQRVTFLRTLLSRRPLLLFDEPFANLDDACTKVLSSLLIEEQNRVGFATVIVTHNNRHKELLEAEAWAIEDGGLRC